MCFSRIFAIFVNKIFAMFKFGKANLIKQYNALREKSNHARFCNAPTTSLRFHRNGGIQFCCRHIDFQYLSEKSIKEIWFGNEMDKIRKSFNDYQIPQSCNFCAMPFYAKDFSIVNALSFDYIQPNKNGYPVMMDFSLENTCNLACIMCDASLSSKIQQQKRTKPKAKSYCYDENFVEQIVEFIPHLKYSVFTGGEPFLINIYFQIWQKIIELNPETIINVVTNGTVLNQRVLDFVDNANVNVTVSIDSFNPDTYGKIRIGAKLDDTLRNVDKFAEICCSKNTRFTITVCPMIINAFEIPEIVNKCNEQNWGFSYNTVIKPWNQALWSLEIFKIREIIEYYKSFDIYEKDELSINNKANFYTLISLLENWLNRVSILNSKCQSSKELIKMRNKLNKLLQQKLSKSTIDYSQKIKMLIDGIPDLLIRKQLISYVDKLSASMITNEFLDNDEDTIIDHFCIVAFNL